MNRILITFVLMIFIIVVGGLIGNFFDLESEYYMPYLCWGIALCIFSLILNNNYENIYLQ